MSVSIVYTLVEQCERLLLCEFEGKGLLKYKNFKHYLFAPWYYKFLKCSYISSGPPNIFLPNKGIAEIARTVVCYFQIPIQPFYE